MPSCWKTRITDARQRHPIRRRTSYRPAPRRGFLFLQNDAPDSFDDVFACPAHASGVVRQGRNFCAKRCVRTLCSAKSGVRASTVRQPKFSRGSACDDPSRRASASAAQERGRIQDAKKQREKCAFLFSRSIDAHAFEANGRMDGRRIPTRGLPIVPAEVEKNFGKVLTLEKSVIRFRPSRTLLRKQVSRVIATKRTTTRFLNRTVIEKYVGFASLRKCPARGNASFRFMSSTRVEPVAGVGVHGVAAAIGCDARSIRSGAPGALAVAAGSDSRGVFLQLG